MPKNQVSDPITDQEIAFAHLVLAGTMTDRSAAEAAGLNPDTAAYTKAKPRVRAYMLEHRAAVREQRVQQEAESQCRLNFGREQVLTRLWEIANLSPEMTRGSVTAQVKALSMIVAIEGLIPSGTNERRAVFSQKESAPPPTAQINAAAWRREQQAKTTHSQPGIALDPQEEPNLAGPPPGAAADATSPRGIIPGPNFDPGDSAFVERFTSLATTTPAPRVPVFADLAAREPLSLKMNGFGPRR
jgi:hypothetical protein